METMLRAGMGDPARRESKQPMGELGACGEVPRPCGNPTEPLPCPRSEA